jgi:hypothetical protein
METLGSVTVLLACVGAMTTFACNNAPAAGSGGSAGNSLPLLPAECDTPLPEADMVPDLPDGGAADDLSLFVAPIRVWGNTVYYQYQVSHLFHEAGASGIYAVDVPDGVPRLVVPAITSSAIADVSAADAGSTAGEQLFEEFWVDETTITGAIGGALYVAPRAGGVATHVPGTEPFPVASQAAYERAGDFLYAVGLTSAGRRVEQQIYRAPWAGGAWKALNIIVVEDPVAFIAGDSGLVYQDYAGVWSVQSSAMTASAVSAIKPFDLLLGAEDYPYIATDGPLGEAMHSGAGPWQVQQVRSADDASKPWTLPVGIEPNLGAVVHPALVSSED